MPNENNIMNLRDLSKKNQEKVYSKSKEHEDSTVKKSAITSILDEISLGETDEKENDENVYEVIEDTEQTSDEDKQSISEEDVQDVHDVEDESVYSIEDREEESNVIPPTPEWKTDDHEEHKPPVKPVFVKPDFTGTIPFVGSKNMESGTDFKKSDSSVTFDFTDGEVKVAMKRDGEDVFSVVSEKSECTEESVVSDSISGVTVRYRCYAVNEACVVLSIPEHDDFTAEIEEYTDGSGCSYLLKSKGISFKTSGASKCSVYNLSAETFSGTNSVKMYF